MNDLSPIGLSTYSRLEHVMRTVSALKNNTLAKHSELHIFSDAAKPGDELKVKAVRDFLKTIDGFKQVFIYEREQNNRIANNRGGIRMLLEKYGRLIFVEEDAVTSPYFLEFMNNGLDNYKDRKEVFAVCGYFPPIKIPAKYNCDAVLSPRMNAWAFAIWKDRYDQIAMNVIPEDYKNIFRDKGKSKEYRVGGDIVMWQLEALSKGLVDGLDIRIDYTMYIKGRKYTLCPTKSLVDPIGLDGSGEHWKSTSHRHRIEFGQSNGDYSIDCAKPDKDIIRKFRAFNNKGVSLVGKFTLALYYFGAFDLGNRIKQLLKWK